jgi:hypothetical protein
MKKWIFILLVIGSIVYANNKKPSLIKHEQQIYQDAVGPAEVIDEAVYDSPHWEGLEFVDWKIATATRDKSKMSLVSFGIINYILVVDSEWAHKTFDIKSRDPGSVTK